MKNDTVLYENIKKRRQALNMSQQALAEAVGYSGKSMVSQVEKGMIDLPSTMITKFAKALDCTEAYLMGWDDEKKESPNSNDESIKTMVEWGKKFSDYSPEQINKALGIATLYEKSSPEVQAAIETLLKSVRQET